MHLLQQKQIQLQLQSQVLSHSSDCGLALARSVHSCTGIWDKEWTWVKRRLSEKKKKVTVYPDQFLNLVYCIPVGAIRSYKGEIAARGEPETGVGEQ